MKARCIKCKARVEVLAEHAGQTIQCGECGAKLRVPAARRSAYQEHPGRESRKRRAGNPLGTRGKRGGGKSRFSLSLGAVAAGVGDGGRKTYRGEDGRCRPRRPGVRGEQLVKLLEELGTLRLQ